jgi:hypothetical protein
MPKLEQPATTGHESGEEPTITGSETATEQRPHANRAPLADVQRDERPDTEPAADEHEGATERDISDRTGPGVGYDQEPEREKNDGGVS